MFSKKSIVSSLFMVLFLGFFITNTVAKDDDDNIAAEIAADLLIGVGIAICEEFVICKSFMLMITFIFVIILLIGLCAGEITCADLCNGRNARRGLTAGTGYGLARSYRGR
jgi:hypothetical protein